VPNSQWIGNKTDINNAGGRRCRISFIVIGLLHGGQLINKNKHVVMGNVFKTKITMYKNSVVASFEFCLITSKP
jgi:hypothetical protein